MRQENPLYLLIRDWQKKDKNFSECGKREAKIDSDCYLPEKSKTLKPQKIFISLFFEVLRLLI